MYVFTFIILSSYHHITIRASTCISCVILCIPSLSLDFLLNAPDPRMKNLPIYLSSSHNRLEAHPFSRSTFFFYCIKSIPTICPKNLAIYLLVFPLFFFNFKSKRHTATSSVAIGCLAVKIQISKKKKKNYGYETETFK